MTRVRMKFLFCDLKRGRYVLAPYIKDTFNKLTSWERLWKYQSRFSAIDGSALFQQNGVRIWNNLSNEIRQLPKAIFKRNIHYMLLQKLSEEISILIYWIWICFENWTHFICIILPASHVIRLILLWIFVFPKCYTGQYSTITIISFYFTFPCFLLYISKLCFLGFIDWFLFYT